MSKTDSLEWFEHALMACELILENPKQTVEDLCKKISEQLLSVKNRRVPIRTIRSHLVWLPKAIQG